MSCTPTLVKHLGNVDYANCEEFYHRLGEEILNHFQQLVEDSAIFPSHYNEEDLTELCGFCRVCILGYMLQYLLLQSNDLECTADDTMKVAQGVTKKHSGRPSKKDDTQPKPALERTNFWRLLESSRMDYTRKVNDLTDAIFRGDMGVIC